MALTEEYNEVWKWLSVDWSVIFDVYWKMFDPNLPSVPAWTITVHDETTNFDLSWFQQWNEVSLWIIQLANYTASTISWVARCRFQQDISGSWITSDSS